MDFNTNGWIEMEGLISVGLFTFFCWLHATPNPVARNFLVGGLGFFC
jgi:hypothetical protein